MNKHAQVTIFIIVGVVIVVGILGSIIFMGQVDVETPADLGPQAFIDKCVRDVVEESVDKMLRNGGEILATRAIAYQGEE